MTPLYVRCYLPLHQRNAIVPVSSIIDTLPELRSATTTAFKICGDNPNVYATLLPSGEMDALSVSHMVLSMRGGSSLFVALTESPSFQRSWPVCASTTCQHSRGAGADTVALGSPTGLW